MKIGLIDNDLVKRGNHNFPNLAIMKLSSHHKKKGDEVELIGFDEINPMSLFSNDFDLIYVSKAFTDTETPEYIFKMNNVKIGGTGFYFDKAESLPYEIEHSKPDYDIYKKAYSFIKNKTFFDEYSIGYTTRGCFRHCEFCVNKNLNKVELHSPIDEFYDNSKKKIALLDDNILGLPNKDLFKIFDRFKEINIPIQYRQGMDIRLMTEERAKKLLSIKYDGNYIFAFDKMEYLKNIEDKIILWRNMVEKYTENENRKFIRTKMYLLCAFDINGIYNETFYKNDIISIFIRLKIMCENKIVPYLMRYEKWRFSKYKQIYIDLLEFLNGQNGIISGISFNDYINIKNKKSKIYCNDFKHWFDVKYNWL